MFHHTHPINDFFLYNFTLESLMVTTSDPIRQGVWASTGQVINSQREIEHNKGSSSSASRRYGKTDDDESYARTDAKHSEQKNLRQSGESNRANHTADASLNLPCLPFGVGLKASSSNEGTDVSKNQYAQVSPPLPGATGELNNSKSREGNVAVKGSSNREGANVSHVESAQVDSSAGTMTASRTTGSVSASDERQDKTALSHTAQDGQKITSYSGATTVGEHIVSLLPVSNKASKLSMEGNIITIAAESGTVHAANVRTKKGEYIVVSKKGGCFECNWFNGDKIDRELDETLRSVQESDRGHFAELIMQRAGRPAMLDLIKSSTRIPWSTYLHFSDDSPTIRGKIVAAIGINDQTLKDYSGEIYLENLGDLKLTCKELPKCFNRIRKATLVLGDTLHINSYVEFDDVVVNYNFSGKSVIVVKGGTEKKPVNMKEVEFYRVDKESSSVSTSPSESFLLDVESHVTLDNCKLSRSTGGGALVHDGGQLVATNTVFEHNTAHGLEVRGRVSKAVFKKGCKLSDSTEGCGALVLSGGSLKATGTKFSGNKKHGVWVAGAGSEAVLKEGCTLSKNEVHGAVLSDGGQLKATGTTFSGNKKDGVFVAGASSKAVLEEGCKLVENEVDGVLVAYPVDVC
ncbi:hypothetical protein TSOC_004827, partial [Tetrabaena socialis]